VRRPVAIVLIACAVAAGMLVLGSALGAGSGRDATAPPVHAAHASEQASPLRGLNATFRRIAPAARCDAGATKARAARRLRAKALAGVADAPPRVVNRKKASMRRAIRLLRNARDLCEEAAAAPPGGVVGPGAPSTPGSPPVTVPAPSPPPPGSQTISLSAAGSDFEFIPSTPVTATAGVPIRLALANASGFQHTVGARTPPPPPHTELAEAPVAAPGGGTTFVDVTLAAGAYQIFCGVGSHAEQGMVVPLTVTP
jgi:hypothetical protein